MDMRTPSFDAQLDEDERQALLALADAALTALAFVFLGLLVLEFAVPLAPAAADWVRLAGYLIWAVFALEFGTRLALAADRLAFLRSNWLSGIAVVVPAFRVLRVTRALRALRVVRLVTGTSRGTRALRRLVGFGGIGYVLAFSVLVVFSAGPGIASLERGQPGAEVTSVADGLWWTATTMATLGSQDQLVSAEGRLLGFLVMVSGLAISGYVTAVLAVFLLGLRDGSGRSSELAALHDEIRQLRREMGATGTRPAIPRTPPDPGS